MSTLMMRGFGVAIACMLCLPMVSHGQSAGSEREAARLRREARRETSTVRTSELPGGNGASLAERERVEGALRTALARRVRERLGLNGQQTSRLVELNRRFGLDRVRLVREERRIRRALRQSISDGDSSRAPETARLLDALLEVQRERLELQQKEQSQLSEFLSPEQRARYIGMMEQLRRRIQARSDSGLDGRL